MIKTNKRILQIICILLLMALILICNNHEVEAEYYSEFYCLNQGYRDPDLSLGNQEDGDPTPYPPIFTYLHHNRHDCAKYYIWENYGRRT